MGEYLEKHFDKFFPKYDDQTLLEEICAFKNHSIVKIKKLENHFFKEVRFNAKYFSSQRANVVEEYDTPYDLLNNDKYIQRLIDEVLYTEKNKNFFGESSEQQRIETYLRFCGGIASNFDSKHVLQMQDYAKTYFDDYFTRFNVHDPSCGWGTRMMVTILRNNNYFGTDPNSKLNEKLNEACTFLRTQNKRVKGDIRCQGSEIFIPEWEDKMDYSFTSPPYFDMEIYTKEDTQSINKHGTGDTGYKNWVEYFVKPTVANIHKYVKDGGFASINIKNIKKYNLYDDWFNAFKTHGGFEFHEELVLKWASTKTVIKSDDSDTLETQEETDKNNYQEKVMIFKVVK